MDFPPPYQMLPKFMVLGQETSVLFPLDGTLFARYSAGVLFAPKKFFLLSLDNLRQLLRLKKTFYKDFQWFHMVRCKTGSAD